MGSLVFLLVAGAIAASQAADVKISLFYETLCPYSKRFVTDQLYPAYQKHGELLEVEFLPYGNARVVEGGYVCQHGELECHGNYVQACAIDVLSSQDQIVDFVHCIMDTAITYTETSGAECAEKLNIDYTPIGACFNSTVADELMQKYSDTTENLNPPLLGVPSVAINDVFDYDQSDAATNDLESFIQGLLEQH